MKFYLTFGTFSRTFQRSIWSLNHINVKTILGQVIKLYCFSSSSSSCNSKEGASSAAALQTGRSLDDRIDAWRHVLHPVCLLLRLLLRLPPPLEEVQGWRSGGGGQEDDDGFGETQPKNLRDAEAIGTESLVGSGSSAQRHYAQNREPKVVIESFLLSQ